MPLQTLPEAGAAFEIFNSPLSEYACLGFEYGYSVAAPESLVLWEAQYGDFVNGAQIVIDQFLVAGLSKWQQNSRLTLLLPHGYEGNGPEHSSAKLERFLQLAAQENIRVANCTTAAQYFHLLRRQALDATPRPLVLMTPKGLLRLKQASSTLAELAEGGFQPVLDDPSVQDREAIRRLVLCSGKVYYDLVGHEQHEHAPGVAVVRLEQLYPFPVDAAAALTASYPHLAEVVWAQEEPQNMGAWRSIRHRLEAASPAGVAPRFVGPPVARQPERGLSDRPSARAGSDRARGAVLGSLARRAAALAHARRALGEQRRGELRAMRPRRLEHLPALSRRESAPELHRRQRDAERVRGTEPGHGAILAVLLLLPLASVLFLSLSPSLRTRRAHRGGGSSFPLSFRTFASAAGIVSVCAGGVRGGSTGPGAG